MNCIRMSFFAAGTVFVMMATGCASSPNTTGVMDDPLVQRASRLATASLSDAMDQVLGRRGFMASSLRPVGHNARMCGRAVTVLARADEDAGPPTHTLDVIDTADPGAVLVVVMEGQGGVDVAAFGGLMCTAATMRGLAGAVLDAGCRDIVEIGQAGLPVFARAGVPASSVGRYATVASMEPVTCGGVVIYPDDVVVADWDGIVVLPADDAERIIDRAEELEAKEAEAMRAVRELKSLKKALDRTNRI